MVSYTKLVPRIDSYICLYYIINVMGMSTALRKYIIFPLFFASCIIGFIVEQSVKPMRTSFQCSILFYRACYYESDVNLQSILHF